MFDMNLSPPVCAAAAASDLQVQDLRPRDVRRRPPAVSYQTHVRHRFDYLMYQVVLSSLSEFSESLRSVILQNNL